MFKIKPPRPISAKFNGKPLLAILSPPMAIPNEKDKKNENKKQDFDCFYRTARKGKAVEARLFSSCKKRLIQPTGIRKTGLSPLCRGYSLTKDQAGRAEMHGKSDAKRAVVRLPSRVM